MLWLRPKISVKRLIIRGGTWSEELHKSLGLWHGKVFSCALPLGFLSCHWFEWRVFSPLWPSPMPFVPMTNCLGASSPWTETSPLNCRCWVFCPIKRKMNKTEAEEENRRRNIFLHAVIRLTSPSVVDLISLSLRSDASHQFHLVAWSKSRNKLGVSCQQNLINP